MSKGPDPEAGPGADPQAEDRQLDRDLLAAHLAGDPTAFGTLFARHRDRLWAVALRTTGNPEDAADALQDGLISAFRRAETFRGEAAVTTWLHRIVVNASLDRLRRNKVRSVDPLPDDLDEQAARGAVLAEPDAAGDPEAHALAGDRRERVLAALDELPPDQRAALVLVDMEGYPVAEAAAILEIPDGTVKSRCARGRSRLAGLLHDLRPGPAQNGTATPPRASHPGDPPRMGSAQVPDPRQTSTPGGEQP
ncbi:MAG: RNA polymerase sigma factor SigM [Marmoricola sp.]